MIKTARPAIDQIIMNQVDNLNRQGKSPNQIGFLDDLFEAVKNGVGSLQNVSYDPNTGLKVNTTKTQVDTGNGKVVTPNVLLQTKTPPLKVVTPPPTPQKPDYMKFMPYVLGFGIYLLLTGKKR